MVDASYAVAIVNDARTSDMHFHSFPVDPDSGPSASVAGRLVRCRVSVDSAPSAVSPPPPILPARAACVHGHGERGNADDRSRRKETNQKDMGSDSKRHKRLNNNYSVVATVMAMLTLVGAGDVAAGVVPPPQPLLRVARALLAALDRSLHHASHQHPTAEHAAGLNRRQCEWPLEVIHSVCLRWGSVARVSV